MVIEQSHGWCCELCGALITGKCNNVNGYVTHIDSCLTEYQKELKKKKKAKGKYKETDKERRQMPWEKY